MPSMTIAELATYHEGKASTYRAMKLRELARHPEKAQRVDAASFREAFHLRALALLRTLEQEDG